MNKRPRLPPGVVLFDAEYWRRQAKEQQPDGSPPEEDRGERRRKKHQAKKDGAHDRKMQIRIGTSAGRVVLHFSILLNFFAMSPDQAIRIGGEIVAQGQALKAGLPEVPRSGFFKLRQRALRLWWTIRDRRLPV